MVGSLAVGGGNVAEILVLGVVVGEDNYLVDYWEGG